MTNGFIKSNKDLFWTHADKGNVAAIMKNDDYINKINDMLNGDCVYEIITNDPAVKLKQILHKL